MLDVQVNVRGLNETTRSMMELPAFFARARRSALKSLGYAVQQDLKSEGRQLGPRLNPHTGVLSKARNAYGQRQWIKGGGRYKRSGTQWSQAGRSGGRVGMARQQGLVKQRFSTRMNPFGRLVNMVRFQVDIEDNLVEIGLLQKKRQYYEWMRKNSPGFSTAITKRMRKFFFGIGFPLKRDTTQLSAPARPWISRVDQKWRQEAPMFFQNKFWEASNRYASGNPLKR